MVRVRDVFQIDPDRMRAAKEIAREMAKMEEAGGGKRATVLTDLVGEYYTLVLEADFAGLGEYQKALAEVMGNPRWQQTYAQFRSAIRGGRREIFNVEG